MAANTCQGCNGWGVVLQISTPPPKNKEARTASLKYPNTMVLRQTICQPCGGYGTREQR